MLTIICITILAYWIMGKEIDSLLKKVKNYDWRGKINELYIKIRPYALKAGRTATRPLLQFYYVMVDEKTTTLDRVCCNHLHRISGKFDTKCRISTIGCIG